MFISFHHFLTTPWLWFTFANTSWLMTITNIVLPHQSTHRHHLLLTERGLCFSFNPFFALSLVCCSRSIVLIVSGRRHQPNSIQIRFGLIQIKHQSFHEFFSLKIITVVLAQDLHSLDLLWFDLICVLWVRFGCNFLRLVVIIFILVITSKHRHHYHLQRAALVRLLFKYVPLNLTFDSCLFTFRSFSKIKHPSLDFDSLPINFCLRTFFNWSIAFPIQSGRSFWHRHQ